MAHGEHNYVDGVQKVGVYSQWYNTHNKINYVATTSHRLTSGSGLSLYTTRWLFSRKEVKGLDTMTYSRHYCK